GACCETQAALTVDEPAPPDDNRSRIVSRESGAVELFEHNTVVPPGRPIVGTLLQARMLKHSRADYPSVLLTVSALTFPTPCVIPPFRWALCNRAAGGVGRFDLVNPATHAPWTTTDLEAAQIGVQHAPSTATNRVTWISWEVIYED